MGRAFDATCRPSAPPSPSDIYSDNSKSDDENENPSLSSAPTAPLTLDGAAAVLRRVAAAGESANQEGAGAGAVLATVAPGFDPSPALEGRACVYLLRVPAAVGGEGLFYVGETESVRRRLEQHRCVHAYLYTCLSTFPYGLPSASPLIYINDPHAYIQTNAN